jgi:hypothetical protein
MSKKLNILKYAKTQGIICGFAGLFIGVLYSFGGLTIDTLVTLEWIDPVIWENTPGLSYGTFLAFLSIIAMPLYFGGIGYLFALVGAYLFNKLKHPFKNMDMDFNKK